MMDLECLFSRKLEAVGDLLYHVETANPLSEYPTNLTWLGLPYSDGLVGEGSVCLSASVGGGWELGRCKGGEQKRRRQVVMSQAGWNTKRLDADPTPYPIPRTTAQYNTPRGDFGYTAWADELLHGTKTRTACIAGTIP